MFVPTLVCATLVLGGPASLDTLTGKIRITGTSFKKTVSVVVEDQPVALAGNLLDELERLGSITVEVIGRRAEGKLVVSKYRILDIGGGATPVIGVLVAAETGLALNDGGGKAIPLSLPSRAKSRLMGKIGAKVWVHGKSLVSGELKVRRYGILKDPPKVDKGEPAAAQP